MAYLHQRGSWFLSIPPQTSSKHVIFRSSVLRGEIHWPQIHEKYNDEGELVDWFSTCELETQTTEGYRLIWYHNTLKAKLDALSRLTQLDDVFK